MELWPPALGTSLGDLAGSGREHSLLTNHLHCYCIQLQLLLSGFPAMSSPHAGFRASLFLAVQSKSLGLPLWWELRQPRKGRSTASSLKRMHIKGWSLSSSGTCNHNFLCAAVTVYILWKSLPTELIFSFGEIWAAFYSLIIIYQPLSCSPLLAGCSKSTQSTREQWTENIFKSRWDVPSKTRIVPVKLGHLATPKKTKLDEIKIMRWRSRKICLCID